MWQLTLINRYTGEERYLGSFFLTKAEADQEAKRLSNEHQTVKVFAASHWCYAEAEREKNYETKNDCRRRQKGIGGN